VRPLFARWGNDGAPTPVPPRDDLLCFPFGLEHNAARPLIKTGEVRARKIGRRWYAKRSDVLALVDHAPPVPPAKASGESLRQDLAAIDRAAPAAPSIVARACNSTFLPCKIQGVAEVWVPFEGSIAIGWG